MVTTRNTSEDLNRIIRALEQRMEEMQRRHEEMQKKHEEEMAVVWAECLAHLRGQTANVNDGEKTLPNGEDDREAHSNAREKEEKQEGKDEKGESLILVKNEVPSVPIPFVQAIMDVQISDQFIPPQFKTYDGTTDPEAHVKSFINGMTFRIGCDAIWC